MRSPTASLLAGALSAAAVVACAQPGGAELAVTAQRLATTQLTVEPGAFDFMELRRGAPRATLPFTISNPGPVAANLDRVRLAGAPALLTLQVEGSYPLSLPSGASLAGQLALATDDVVDLAQTGAALQIDVDGEQLAYPVLGKVTTPSAYVTPQKLELGTACVGNQVRATLMMVNNGTARLTMAPPEVEDTITPRYDSPTSYPAPLLAGTSATLSVAPTAQVSGPLSATLTWAVDAPRSPFVIPIRLDYIEIGTAISPASINVPPVMVGELSGRYPVTLQNCDPRPVQVVVSGVIATRGEAAAWEVQPSDDARTLAPQDKLTINVAFSPRRQGHHAAEIRITVDGEARVVSLEGDGIDPDFERTSFYACGCRSFDPAGGAPLALAIALSVGLGRRGRRGRRRRVSAPRPSGSS